MLLLTGILLFSERRIVIKSGSYCTGYLGETGYDDGSQATEGGYFGNIICLKNV